MVRLNQPSELVDEVQQLVKKAEHFLSEIKSASIQDTRFKASISQNSI